MLKQQLIRLAKAAGYSLQGLWFVLKNEPAFIMESLICLILIPIAIVLQVPVLAKLFMIASLLLVLIVELVNSAIETTVNRISLEKNPLSKQAKDMASAAVFITVMNAIMVWTVVLLQ